MLVTSYEDLKLIKSFGLSYDSIHACANGCVFFQDTLSHLQVCPKCGTDRFVDGSKYIPQKVFWHFTLTPRLLQMYKCKSLAQLLTWHTDGTDTYGLVRSVVGENTIN
jgi:predicted  nucleic acid-binding Zn-ribbon protein